MRGATEYLGREYGEAKQPARSPSLIPLYINPLSAASDGDGIPDGAQIAAAPSRPGGESARLAITSIRCVGDNELRIAFRSLPGTLAYKYVLEGVHENVMSARKAGPP